jgi:hypothetical protein
MKLVSTTLLKTSWTPKFKEVVEPLQVDEWINTMEQKFSLVRMIEELKVEYAAHQLQGPLGFGCLTIAPPIPREPLSRGIAAPLLSEETTSHQAWWK